MLPIYIVSLKKDVEKRKSISETLKKFNLKFEFIDAIYGKELSEDFQNSIRIKSSGKILNRGYSATAGEIGCTLSHINLYKKMLSNNLNWVCILEDDAILDQKFSNFIKQFNSNKLDTESVYILGGQNGLDEKQIVKSIKNYHMIGGQKFSKTISSEHVIYRTCCYIFSLSLAKKILNLSEHHFILADDWNFLVKNKYIKNIYLSDFVDHPLDLSVSHLEIERKAAQLKKNFLYKEKFQLFIRIRRAIRWRIRLFFLNFYKYVEKIDKR